jgi:YidC/Oxa1 family membrane protein insertase
MILQQQMNPAPTDPAQKVMLLYFMPFFLVFVLSQMPSGVVIYWICSNILGMAQQYAIKRDSQDAVKNLIKS